MSPLASARRVGAAEMSAVASMKRAKASAKAALATVSKRPHLGSLQIKYQYDVKIHTLVFQPHVKLPTSALSVMWTRGSKTALTAQRTLAPGARHASFEQQLTLIATLFRNDTAGGVSTFSEKLATFALVQQTRRGASTLAKCKVDLSAFAHNPARNPARLCLAVSKGSIQVEHLTPAPLLPPLRPSPPLRLDLHPLTFAP